MNLEKILNTMKLNHITTLLIIATFFALASCDKNNENLDCKSVNMPDNATTLNSPDGQLELKFALIDSVPYYSLCRAGQDVVLPSKMGFNLEWRDDIAHGFVVKDVQHSTFDETWAPVWGEEDSIRNHYNEMLVTLEQPAGSVSSMDKSTDTKATVMQIRFRL